MNKPDNILYFKELVASVCWYVLKLEDVDVQYLKFHEIIDHCYNIAFPVLRKDRNLLIRHTNGLITPGILISSRKLKDLFLLSLHGYEAMKDY